VSSVIKTYQICRSQFTYCRFPDACDSWITDQDYRLCINNTSTYLLCITNTSTYLSILFHFQYNLNRSVIEIFSAHLTSTGRHPTTDLYRKFRYCNVMYKRMQVTTKCFWYIGDNVCALFIGVVIWLTDRSHTSSVLHLYLGGPWYLILLCDRDTSKQGCHIKWQTCSPRWHY